MKQNLRSIIFITLCFLLPLYSMAHGVSEADQQAMQQGGLWDFIVSGAKHMLTGYDHLLFLTGVIFYLNNFKDIVRFITVFTIGHSITLISATYMGIKANEYLIDAVIAFSVLYKGFENLGGFKKLLGTTSPNLLFMVFVFGLIHGFGLSTRLQAFNIGVDQFLPKILCFNVGVELGQIIALIPIVFIISRWNKLRSYNVFYDIVNRFLIFAGIGLMIFQLYNYFNGHVH